MSNTKGPFVAIVTPFDSREEVNVAALVRQVERQATAGNGVFCAGANAEIYTPALHDTLPICAGNTHPQSNNH